MKRLAPIAFIALAACNAADLTKAQNTQAQIANTVAGLCTTVNDAAALAAPFAAVPQIGSLLMFANASCATAGAVSIMTSKALADPNTTAWLAKLAADIRAGTPARRS